MSTLRTGGESHELLSNPFVRPYLVAVEGRHDQALIAALIDHMELDGFQVHSFGGKSSWRKKVLAVGRDDSFLDNVNRVGLVRDADLNGRGAWQSCVEAVGVLGYSQPMIPLELSEVRNGKQFSVMVVPDRDKTGALEELLLPTLDTDRLECVDGMFECLRSKNLGTRGNPKDVVQAYYGTFPSLVRDTTVALEKKIIDLDHENFESLKVFLRNIAQV